MRRALPGPETSDYAVRSGRIAAGSRVLFVHTGGQPALFAYADSLGSWLSEAPDGRAR